MEFKERQMEDLPDAYATGSFGFDDVGLGVDGMKNTNAKNLALAFTTFMDKDGPRGSARQSDSEVEGFDGFSNRKVNLPGCMADWDPIQT